MDAPPSPLAAAEAFKAMECIPYSNTCIGSPALEGYRNRTQFGVGYDRSKKLTVGFRLGKGSEGIDFVECADIMLPTASVVMEVRKSFEQFLNKAGQANPHFVPYDRFAHSGVFRMFEVRNNRKGDMLVDVQCKMNALGEDEKTQLFEMLREWYATLHLDERSGFFFQVHDAPSDRAPVNQPWTHLAGATHINENLLGLSFHISSNSFFQVNPPATELLYDAVRELAQVDEQTVLLDICCGTGTIGLTMASRAAFVLGVDNNAEAIADAKANAQLNGVESDRMRVLCVNSEKVLEKALAELPASLASCKVVAVVDPSRSGLHPTVLRLLRNFSRIHRIVYISCNQKAFESDVTTLCQPSSKTLTGAPFLPISSFSLDLFPYTEHFEYVCLLDRIKS